MEPMKYVMQDKPESNLKNSKEKQLTMETPITHKMMKQPNYKELSQISKKTKETCKSQMYQLLVILIIINQNLDYIKLKPEFNHYNKNFNKKLNHMLDKLLCTNLKQLKNKLFLMDSHIQILTIDFYPNLSNKIHKIHTKLNNFNIPLSQHILTIIIIKNGKSTPTLTNPKQPKYSPS